jgi:hypothetical protein
MYCLMMIAGSASLEIRALFLASEEDTKVSLQTVTRGNRYLRGDALIADGSTNSSFSAGPTLGRLLLFGASPSTLMSDSIFRSFVRPEEKMTVEMNDEQLEQPHKSKVPYDEVKERVRLCLLFRSSFLT